MKRKRENKKKRFTLKRCFLFLGVKRVCCHLNYSIFVILFFSLKNSIFYFQNKVTLIKFLSKNVFAVVTNELIPRYPLKLSLNLRQVEESILSELKIRKANLVWPNTLLMDLWCVHVCWFLTFSYFNVEKYFLPIWADAFCSSFFSFFKICVCVWWNCSS